jgi:hypothetical protein
LLTDDDDVDGYDVDGDDVGVVEGINNLVGTK